MVLNLARALRPQTFDQLIGQSINVRMLKNSLFRNYFFPVYLLTGQKGTGKTSLARILAAALNCSDLTLFQKEPKLHPLPCLKCSSCTAMQIDNHPDFIEMDGASQTGVDNIRTIIEAASFMPVLGAKKIYLIDEAHMLSKSAFNAFLKMLEDPPAGVHFILATTEHAKIIDTVRSRCFQLFFSPIKKADLMEYLYKICKKENISIQQHALSIIAQESQGSLRDALNLLEQARCAASTISSAVIYEILGYPSEEILEKMLYCLLQPSAQQGIAYIKNSLVDHYSSHKLWMLVAEFFSRMLASLYQADQHPFLTAYIDYASIPAFIKSLHVIYDYEQRIVKSSHGYGLIECMFLELHALATHSHSLKKNSNEPIIKQELATQETIVLKNTPWNQFIDDIQTLKDPLLLSIFKQSIEQKISNDNKELTILFYKDMHFFKEIIDTTYSTWRPLLIKYFGNDTQLRVVFDEQRLEAPIAKKLPQELSYQQHKEYKKINYNSSKKSIQKKIRSQPLDISDSLQWPGAHALQALFGGVAYLE